MSLGVLRPVFKESPSQTAGPYVHIGTNPNWVEITGVWEGDLGLVLVGPDTKGERILVRGRIELPARRETLIAPRSEEGGLPVYTFDVHLQGHHETVFFDV